MFCFGIKSIKLYRLQAEVDLLYSTLLTRVGAVTAGCGPVGYNPDQSGLLRLLFTVGIYPTENRLKVES